MARYSTVCVAWLALPAVSVAGDGAPHDPPAIELRWAPPRSPDLQGSGDLDGLPVPARRAIGGIVFGHGLAALAVGTVLSIGLPFPDAGLISLPVIGAPLIVGGVTLSAVGGSLVWAGPARDLGGWAPPAAPQWESRRARRGPSRDRDRPPRRGRD